MAYRRKTVCKVCQHPKRKLIDKDLLEGELSDRDLCKKWGIINSRGDPEPKYLRRHKGECVANAVRDSVEKDRKSGGKSNSPRFKTLAQEIVASEDCLIEATRKLRARMNLAVDMGEQAESVTDMVSATNAARGLIELQAKLSGQIKDREVIVYADPNFSRVCEIILQRLAPYPEAFQAVLDGLSGELSMLQHPIGIDLVQLPENARDRILADGREYTIIEAKALGTATPETSKPEPEPEPPRPVFQTEFDGSEF